KLRQYGQKYHAQTNRYQGSRRPFEQLRQHDDIIFEPGKCITCGICLQITARHREDFGLTFIGRGFDVRTRVPLNQSLKQGLKNTAAQCVNACPTGAITFK
ncbi:MAG: glutamate synthase, partial [Planctomycetes bacterium]|nr:glutamate synthase [Planctomycetota bacterium]